MKYMSVELYNGECIGLSRSEFLEQIEGCMEIHANDQFVSYKFEEYVVIENKSVKE